MSFKCFFGYHAWSYVGREELPTKPDGKWDPRPHYFPYTIYPIYTCGRCSKRTNESLSVDSDKRVADIVEDLLGRRPPEVQVPEPPDRIELLMEGSS